MMIWRVLLLTVFLGPFAAQAERLTLGSWNIRDLHHSEGHNLRAFCDFPSVRRTSDDFDKLIEFGSRFGESQEVADLIALQEIGTPEALNRIFDPEVYVNIMSPRWALNETATDEGDVYTAITFRRDSGIELLEVDHLEELAVIHSDGRPTRAATGAKFRFAGQDFWFLSVHLKSSCNSNRAIHRSTDDDCETLWAQMPPLRAWIEEKQNSGLPYIVAGDFNRRFREMNFQGDVWKTLNLTDAEDEVVDPSMLAVPQMVSRLCPTRKGTSTQPIDWFIFDSISAELFVQGSFWETRWSTEDIQRTQNGRGLSDHCPISIQLDF